MEDEGTFGVATGNLTHCGGRRRIALRENINGEGYRGTDKSQRNRGKEGQPGVPIFSLYLWQLSVPLYSNSFCLIPLGSAHRPRKKAGPGVNAGAGPLVDIDRPDF
jgi:hypothetical protein